MNTQHYKAASERTDEAERALIPAFKRTPTIVDAVMRDMSKLYDKPIDYKAHADKLAEALRHIAADAQEANEKRNAAEWDFRCTWIEARATQALAAYEETRGTA